MTISELKPEFVFATLAKGTQVICIDFGKGQYIDLGGQLVSAVQSMILDKKCKFFSVTTEG